MKTLAVFISGQGSNLSVFLQNKNKFKDLIVISNKAEAYGLKKAQRMAVKNEVFPHPIDWENLNKKLKTLGVDFIFLAGFMKIVPESFIKEWDSRLFNLHPSLLPKYKGLKSIERAYLDGESLGASIHKVTPEVDAGEILFQEKSVEAHRVKELSLEQVEFYTHVCEQKIINQWIEKWA